MRRVLLIFLGVAVSIGSLVWAMRDTSVADLRSSLSHANWLYLILILAVTALMFWFKAIRWSQLLNPVQPLSAGQLFRPLVIGFGANNILPAHLGEFVRVFVVNRQYRVSATAALSTVVLERILDIVAILVLFAAGLWYAPQMPPEYKNGAVAFSVLCGGMVTVVIVYLIWTNVFLRVTRAVFDFLPFVPENLTGKVLEMLQQGALGLQSLKSPSTLALLLLNSLLQWLLNGIGACAALWALGINVDLSTGLILTGITAFGVMIPAAPGYFGVIQVCFLVAMKAQAMQPSDSDVLAASFFLQVPQYIIITSLALIFMQQLGFGLRQLATSAPDAPQEAEGSGANPSNSGSSRSS